MRIARHRNPWRQAGVGQVLDGFQSVFLRLGFIRESELRQSRERDSLEGLG